MLVGGVFVGVGVGWSTWDKTNLKTCVGVMRGKITSWCRIARDDCHRSKTQFLSPSSIFACATTVCSFSPHHTALVRAGHASKVTWMGKVGSAHLMAYPVVFDSWAQFTRWPGYWQRGEQADAGWGFV